MPNRFAIDHVQDASADQIAGLKKALAAVGAASVTADPGGSRLRATIDWGTSRKDVGQLRGRLDNESGGIVVGVTVDREEAIAAESPRWNRAFTDLVRSTTYTAWGNWSLDPTVTAGAVGILRPETGSFERVFDIFPGAQILRVEAASAWSIESSNVTQTETEVEFKGGYKDPSSGKEVNVGLDVSWTFAHEGSIVSNATVNGRTLVNDFGPFMQQNFAWLAEKAKAYNYGTPGGGVRQGFGMITQVQTCQGGVNIGAVNDSSSFSLVGSIDGVNAMTGGGQVSGSVKGSYKQVKKSKSFESRMWPVQADTAAPAPIAITFQFATFHDRLIMPTWIQPLDGFRVIFDNAHGGTYIADCVVEYTQPGVQNRVRKETTVSGGIVHTIDGIPLDVIDMTLSGHFRAGGDFNFAIPSPLTTLLTGQCTVDLSGVWPWGSHAMIREPNISL